MTPLSKRLIIALAISGALNLLCAGLFVGAALHRSRVRDERAHLEPDRRGGHGPGGARAGKHDDDEKRDKGEGRAARGERRRSPGPFAGLFAGHREVMAARRDATDAARRAVSTALEQEPFDRAALEHSLAALRSETAATQELIHKQLVDTAQSADGPTRHRLAEGFGHMLF